MKIFLSYAREDLDFVDRLSGALVRRGFEVLIDRKDIEALTIGSASLKAWSARPTRLSSCFRRIGLRQTCASGNSIGRGGAASGSPPSWPASPAAKCQRLFRNFSGLLFVGGQDVDVQIGVLATALNSDAEWSRAHTRYQELAERWQELKRPDDHCIPANELRDGKS
jgi:hypothetical protein